MDNRSHSHTSQSPDSSRAHVNPGLRTGPVPDARVDVGSRLGNRELTRFLHSSRIQARLEVSQPHDPLEKEAERVAHEVMRMPEPNVGEAGPVSPRSPPLQRVCSECEEGLQSEALEGEGNVPPISMRRESASSTHETETSHTESFVSNLSGRGEPLPESVRSFMEPRFNADFGAVRIHTGPAAHRSAEEISALAYTTGNNIVFRAGQYDAASDSGKLLLAHELTHVVQQVGAQAPSRLVDHAADPAERGADLATRRMGAGERVRTTAHVDSLQRVPAGDEQLTTEDLLNLVPSPRKKKRSRDDRATAAMIKDLLAPPKHEDFREQD